MGETMQRARTVLAAGGITAAIAITAAYSGGAVAAIKPSPDIDPAARELARTITDDDKKILSRADFAALPPAGRPAAISTTELAGFPTAGRSYMILASGDTTLADDDNKDPDTGTTVNGPFLRGARDVTIFKLKLKTPKNANCLSFSFRFLSEEFPEYKDSPFNDAFIAELNRSTWDAGTNEDPEITAPGNFALGSNGNRISVNATDSASVDAKRARGTTYDGATRLLRASIPVKKSRNTLYLSIFDQGDRQYDSAVFIDDLRINRRSDCEAGTESIGR
jgi:hypothetical protein